MKKKLTKEQRTALRAQYETYHAACSAATVSRWEADQAMHEYVHGKLGAVPARLIRTARRRMAEYRAERAALDAFLASIN